VKSKNQHKKSFVFASMYHNMSVFSDTIQDEANEALASIPHF